MLLPEPCVCQTTPPRRSPSGPAASIVESTAALTAQYWWYFATRFTSPCGSAVNTTNDRTRSRKRAGSKTPRTRTSSAGRLVTTSRPSIVFHGAKCSQPAVKEPIEALLPSEMTVTALGTKIAGMSRR